jgi:diacylglycerol kinase (ATP)
VAPIPDVVVVANPAAGHGRSGSLVGKVAGLLGDAGVDHEIRVSTSAEDLRRLARDAGEQGARIVAVLGGDGSVHLAANGLLGTGAALAVLPAGTGDDFAASVASKKLGDAVKLLVEPKIVPIDVVKLSCGPQVDHYVNIAGAGFDSDVNETANGMSVRLGNTGTYIAAVMKTLPEFQPARFVITVDDEQLDLAAMLVVVGNAPAYGGGMRVLPGAIVNDGLLNVCIVTAISRAGFLRAFPRVFRGTHTTHPNVRMLTGTHVRVEADRRVQVYADGERIGPLPAVHELIPAALPVVVGPEAKVVR